MSKFKYIIAVNYAALAFFLCSCEKSLLYPSPPSVLTTVNAFNDANGLNLAVLGVYNSLQSRIQSDYLIMGMPSDNMWNDYAIIPGSGQISDLIVTSQNQVVNDFWKANYSGIFKANSVLSNIDKPKDYTTGEKEQYIGEAKFLRAKFYFDLVRIFGDVPLVKDAVNIKESRNIQRTSEKDIYNYIIEDLTDAIGKLQPPSKVDWGRSSKGAAIALLVKVYIYSEDWINAKKYAEMLISEFNYKLVPNYKDLFDLKTEQNSETIFAIPFVSGTNGQSLGVQFSPLTGVYQTITNGSHVARPTYDLRSSFDKDDSRLLASIRDTLLPYNYKIGDPPSFYPYFKKWVTSTSDVNSSGLDVPVLRFADILLLYAEALYNLNDPGEALKQINKVRERAFHDNIHNYQLSDILTKETFYDKLLIERRLELVAENDRWFDLVRTKRFVQVIQNVKGVYGTLDSWSILPKKAKEYMKYFPIPQEQIDLAGNGVLTQNFGY